MSVPDRATAILAASRAARSGSIRDTDVPEAVQGADASVVLRERPFEESGGRHRRPAVMESSHRRGVERRSRGQAGGDAERSALPSSRLVRSRDGVWEVPSGLAGARISVPWAAVGGAALVLVVAVGSLLFGLAGSDPHTEPVATAVRSASPTRADTGGGTPVVGGSTRPGSRLSEGALPVATPTAGASAPAQLLVHVVGRVRREGVISVPAGSRVADAIAKAGGGSHGAVLSGLNLARPLVDGEQIVVPDKNGAVVPIATAPPPPGGASGPSSSGAGQGGVVDLNTADQATLETLPGVGPVLAASILEWRAAHGRFTSVDELGEVKGVGEKKLESIRPKVRV